MAPEITSSAFTPLKKLKGGLAYRISTVGLSLQLLFSFAMIVSCVMQIDFLRGRFKWNLFNLKKN